MSHSRTPSLRNGLGLYDKWNRKANKTAESHTKNLYSSRIKSKIDGECSTHENVRVAYAVTIGKKTKVRFNRS